MNYIKRGMINGNQRNKLIAHTSISIIYLIQARNISTLSGFMLKLSRRVIFRYKYRNNGYQKATFNNK